MAKQVPLSFHRMVAYTEHLFPNPNRRPFSKKTDASVLVSFYGDTDYENLSTSLDTGSYTTAELIFLGIKDKLIFFSPYLRHSVFGLCTYSIRTVGNIRYLIRLGKNFRDSSSA